MSSDEEINMITKIWRIKTVLGYTETDRDLQLKVAIEEIEKQAADEQYDLGYNDGEIAGTKAGYSKGHAEGSTDGHKLGYRKGILDSQAGDIDESYLH